MSNNKTKRRGLVGFIVWAVVTVFLVALLATLTILEFTILEPILTTVAGGPMPIKGSGGLTEIYKSEYNSKEESTKAGDELNVRIAEEGFTLLLNEKNALPITGGKKVSVFGKNSVNLVLGGSGSGGGSGKGKTLFDGLTKAGFEYNPTLKAFYENDALSGSGRSKNLALTSGSSEAPKLDIGETPIANYTGDVRGSFASYNDAAIVVISRLGGESWDLPRFQNTKNGGIEGNHYLQLDKNEYDMLDLVTARFNKVILVLNTLTSFQCDFIAEYNNMPDNPRIDAVLWIGGPGATGALAFGDILAGNVNPSGRTVDIYSRDFTKDPTWKNFGDNSQVNFGKDGSALLQNGESANQYYISYDEGVYVGYRYYETRAFVESDNPGSRWYEENVIFPFGYGLSYTTFTQSIEKIEGDLTSGVTITVKVKNTGDKAGKEVVQLYVNKPYTVGGIEKPYVELVDFAKTGSLAAKTGEETIVFKVDPYSLASYDYNDANKNGKKGYELEKGDYTFFISRNSHVVTNKFDSKVVKLAEDRVFASDPVTGTSVVNRYSLEDNSNFLDSAYRLHDVVVNGETRKGMSRSNFEDTFPTAPTAEERDITTDELAALKKSDHNNTAIVALASATTEVKTGVAGNVKLKDLVDPKTGVVDFNDQRWNTILDNLTFDEMLKLVNNGAFQTEKIESIGKNLTNDSDGPIGFVNFMPGLDKRYADNTTFACEIVIGSTWNKDLAYQMGKLVGENGLWGDTKGNGLPYSGWYAPAVNLHRSPFAGRNFEYYSEDPIISGKLAVNVITGARSKGVYTDLKHFALNDQETNRSGVATFCTEQALRELYLKPFEIAVKGLDNIDHVATAKKDGIAKHRGTTGIMSSFNRIGAKWTGGDYRLLNNILREEWGFRGMVISDYKTGNSFMFSRQMLYAGNDLILASLPNLMWTDAKRDSKEDLLVLRAAAKNILYTVASSNSVTVEIVGYNMEWWKALTIALDAIVPVLLAVWGFFAICKWRGVGDSYKNVFVNVFMRGKAVKPAAEAPAEAPVAADAAPPAEAEPESKE